jgi:hypothetical protein
MQKMNQRVLQPSRSKCKTNYTTPKPANKFTKHCTPNTLQFAQQTTPPPRSPNFFE